MPTDEESIESNNKGDGEEKRIERFINSYIARYMEAVDQENPADQFLPPLYNSSPYKIQTYLFENDTIGIVFVKGDEADTITIKEGEFHEVRWVLEDKACEHFIGLKNVEEATTDMANLLAERKSEHDLGFSKKRKALEDMKAELNGLEGDITEMVKVNPWLEERAADQMGRLSTTKGMIDTMEEEVGEEKYKRFRDYLSQLDLLELQLPPSIDEEENEDDELPTLAAVVSETEIEEEAPTPEEAPKKTKPARERPTFVEVKKGRVKTEKKMEAVPSTDLPPEIKKTIFRMNRRLFNLEKKVEPLSDFNTIEMKKMRADHAKMKNDGRALNDQIRHSTDSQNKRIDASARALTDMLSKETKKIRKFAIGMGVVAILMSVLALMLVLYNMGYIPI